VQERAQTNFCPTAHQVFDLFGIRTVQADSCLNSEQNDTLFISVESQEGGWGGGAFWVVGLKFTRDCHGYFFGTLLQRIIQMNKRSKICPLSFTVYCLLIITPHRKAFLS